MEILLDTNFVITCAKQKIDFESIVNGMTDEEIKWIVPDEVLRELRGLRLSKGKGLDAKSIDLAIKMIQNISYSVVKLSDSSSDVDTKIANYVKDKSIILATLDKGLKVRVGNRILTVRGKKGLEII